MKVSVQTPICPSASHPPSSTPCLESTSLQLPPRAAKRKTQWEHGQLCGLLGWGLPLVTAMFPHVPPLALQGRKDDGSHQHKGNTK